MQRAINVFIAYGSHAWMAATPSTRFLSLTAHPDGRALTVREHLKLSITYTTEDPHLMLVIEQEGENVEGSQRYLDAFRWWIDKVVPEPAICPVRLVCNFFMESLVRVPGVLRSLDLSGESDNAVHLAQYRDLLPELVEMDLSYYLSTVRPVTDIQLLRRCEKLRRITLSGTDIVDLSWMNTDVVDMLNVSWCHELTDLDALHTAPKLLELHCNMNPFSDLTPLSGCTRLRHLDLTECEELRNFAPIATLRAHLVHLNLSRTCVASLDFLTECVWLEYLNVNDCGGVADLTPLAGLLFLKHLLIDSTNATSLEPLHLCTRLEELSARRCTLLSDVSPLKHHHALRRLIVGETAVSDVSALKDCPHLQTLYLSDCHGFSAASELGQWPSLSKLYLQRTAVTWDEATEAALKGIAFVDLRDWRRS